MTEPREFDAKAIDWRPDGALVVHTHDKLKLIIKCGEYQKKLIEGAFASGVKEP